LGKKGWSIIKKPLVYFFHRYNEKRRETQRGITDYDYRRGFIVQMRGI